MRKLIIAASLASSLLLAPTAAVADTPGDDHNCAGQASSAGGQEYGSGFGQAVAFHANQQLVDNFGLANCGDAPRQNP